MQAIVSLEDCKKIAHRCTQAGDVVNYRVVPISETPLGFLGDHLRLQIDCGTDPSNNVQRKLDFFLKTVPHGNEDHEAYVNTLGVFKKECLIYMNFLGEFAKYHKQHKVTPTSFLVNPDRFMVLEDLSRKGYHVLEGNEELSLAHWESVMRTMARFHASSIIYEEKRSFPDEKPFRISEHFSTEILEVTFSDCPQHPRYKWARNTAKSVADLMQQYGAACSETVGRHFVEFATEEIFKYICPSKTYRNVLTHADLWKNNIMFNEHLDCVLVDFQLVRYSPPALDLMTTLHVNGSTEFLNQHLTSLIRIYYNTFCESLAQHGINPNSVLTWEDFLESLEHYKMAALTVAAMFATIIFTGDELSSQIVQNQEVFLDFTFVNRTKYVIEESASNLEYRRRVSDIVIRLADYLSNKIGY